MNTLYSFEKSRKMSKECATRKHLAARSWKLVRNADINIFSSVSTAVDSVENLYSLDSDCFAIVDGNPWCTFIVCVACLIMLQGYSVHCTKHINHFYKLYNQRMAYTHTVHYSCMNIDGTKSDKEDILYIFQFSFN